MAVGVDIPCLSGCKIPLDSPKILPKKCYNSFSWNHYEGGYIMCIQGNIKLPTKNDIFCHSCEAICTVSSGKV
jgi:hypothetical protein